MKKKFLLLCGCFLMALGGTVLTGCGEEEITPTIQPQEPTVPETPRIPEKGSIILSDESMEYLSENNTLQIRFSYPAQQKTLSFTADTTWNLRIESADWLSVSSDSTTNENQITIEQSDNALLITGEGSEKPYNIYVRATRNDSTETRKAWIELQALYYYYENPEEAKPHYYSGEISQLTPQLIQYETYTSYAGGVHQVNTVHSYGEEKPLVDWIHIVTIEDLSGIPHFNFKADPNNTGTKREGQIVCTGTDFFGNVLGTDTLTVIQDCQKVEMQVNVSTAGTLQSLIPTEQKYEITDLTLTGNLNGDDIRFIREMAGSDYAKQETNGKLVHLDLTQANIVAGGAPFVSGINELPSYTENNIIGHYMFANCKLISIMLPYTITNIYRSIFENCYNLSNVSMPNRIQSLYGSSFANCISLSTLDLPKDLEEIEISVFQGCINLTTLNIPSQITSINRYAFKDCSKLTQLTLPASLQNLGEGIFEKCTNLNTIHCQATEPPLCSGALGIEEHATLYVPKGTLAKYKDAAAWKNFKEIVEE